ncbi:hypothetical protein CNEO2_1230039 [Clostridium neonatale]|nr:hypothetical protein CNEO2_1230039 [Clostridium neonatale]
MPGIPPPESIAESSCGERRMERTSCTICRFSASVFCASSPLNLFWYSVIFSRVFAISLSIRSILFIAINKFLLSLLKNMLIPVHQPIAFDTGVIDGVALYLAGVAGIALDGIDALPVRSDNKPHMVCAPVPVPVEKDSVAGGDILIAPRAPLPA